MTLGFRALRYSANVALDELTPDEEKKTEISGWVIAVNLILSLGFFIFMYKFVPLLAATKLKNHYPAFGNQILFNVVDGVIRISCSCCSSGAFRCGPTSSGFTDITVPSTKRSSPSRTTIR
jgi:uncharacterized protein YqhQ